MISKEMNVVELLLDNKDREMNINLVSKSMKIGYKSAHNIVKRLEKKGIVRLEQFGKSSRIILNKNSNPLIYEAEHNRKQKILKDKDI